MSDNFAVGELYYVKLHRIDSAGNQVWIGWLGLGSSDGYSSYINPESTLPPQNRVLAVQWVTEVIGERQITGSIISDGTTFDLKNAPHDPEVGPPVSVPILGKRYLRALNYPGGMKYLGGSGDKGFYCYWDSGDSNGNPITTDVWGASYALLESPGPNPGQTILSRQSDNGKIYTYNDYYMGYWKSGNEFEIVFEFIPAAQFTAPHEHWMRDKNAIIGTRSLANIAIPGSHDAGSSNIASRSFGSNLTSKTQGLSIRDQLLAGSRYFDLRIWKDTGNGVWYIYHGADWSTVTLTEVTDQMATFLQNHPEEIVIISLLVEGDESGTYPANVKEGWELFFSKLYTYHLNYRPTPTGTPHALSTVTPDSMVNQSKNLIAFAWDAASSWTFTPSGGGSIYISLWPSGSGPNNGAPLDREGVYVDSGSADAFDILKAYTAYNRNAGQCWIFHTNTPWGIPLAQSLYSKHYYNTPPLAVEFGPGKTVNWPKVNIVNIDFVGDVVKGANLVKTVIDLNT